MKPMKICTLGFSVRLCPSPASFQESFTSTSKRLRRFPATSYDVYPSCFSLQESVTSFGCFLKTPKNPKPKTWRLTFSSRLSLRSSLIHDPSEDHVTSLLPHLFSTFNLDTLSLCAVSVPRGLWSQSLVCDSTVLFTHWILPLFA